MNWFQLLGVAAYLSGAGIFVTAFSLALSQVPLKLWLQYVAIQFVVGTFLLWVIFCLVVLK